MSEPKKSALSSALAGFASKSIDDPFAGSTRNLPVIEEINIVPKFDDVVDDMDDHPKKKKKKDKKGLGVDIMEEGIPGSEETDFLDTLMEDPMYDVRFDQLIESIFDDDEDAELKNNLIALGRKHARMTGINDEETSEIAKAFAVQEQALDSLIEELGRDSLGAQHDIDMMRGLRTRNFKALADLVSAKNSINSTRLSAIKELSSITKTKFDLRMKAKKDDVSGDSAAVASQAIQKLLGTGHNTLLSAIGGRSVASGARDSGASDYEEVTPEEILADNEGYDDSDEDMEDGDLFVKYEGEGVEYVVDFDDTDDDGTPTVYAIDKNGNTVPDYPMPSNIKDLTFTVNELSGQATDQLHRTYKVWKDGHFMNE